MKVVGVIGIVVGVINVNVVIRFVEDVSCVGIYEKICLENGDE